MESLIQSMPRILAIFSLLFLITYSEIEAQEYSQRPPEKSRILFLFDGSGSMLAPWGPTLRINAAKRFLSEFVDSLRVNDHLELALRVYGHQYDSRLQNCEDTRLEVGFSRDNHDRIIEKLMQIEPKGTTPIAYSLEKAAGDFPEKDDIRNIVIIITDGIESCQGDPCAVSLALQRKGIFLKPFIIGIGMTQDFNEQFGCMGEFYDVNNLDKFKSVLSEIIFQSLEETTVSIELLDHLDNRTVTNLNITFINDFTGEPIYDFVHYRDEQGRPDSVFIDPVLSYDIIVNTVPPVSLAEVSIKPGTHNVIEISAPQGTLMVSQPSYTEYEGGVKVFIRQKDYHEIINIQKIDEPVEYLAGTYDIELTTMPRVKYENVEIEPARIKKILVPAPGVVNLRSSFQGYGSVYWLEPESGAQTWLFNFGDKNTLTSQALQPGRYKAVFRAKNSKGSKYTKAEKFEIRSGDSITINF